MENIVKVFLTTTDSDIEKYLHRDPLREQNIWTNLANKLYPHVNSVTDDIKGFIIASLALEIIDKKFEIFKDKQDTRSKIIIMYEMIITYMLIEELKNYDISFFGKEKGGSEYDKKNGNPIIYVNSDKVNENSILASQERLGYTARYQTKVSDIKTDILELAFGNKLNLVINFFYEKLEKRDEPLKYKDCFKNDKNNVREILLNALKDTNKHQDEYLEILKIKDNKEKGLDFILNELKDDNSKIENIIDKSIAEGIIVNENEPNLLKDIKSLEIFLTALNNIFYLLLTYKDEDFKNIKNGQINEKLTELIKKLRRNARTSYKYAKDYKNLNEALKNNYNDAYIIEAIILDHQELMEKDKLDPWIKKDNKNDNYIINIHAKKEIKENTWDHYYYIDSVRNIIRSMREWSKKTN